MAACVQWTTWLGLPVAELLDMILENAVSNTKKSCSLVCRFWIDAVRRHIFDHITIHTVILLRSLPEVPARASAYRYPCPHHTMAAVAANWAQQFWSVIPSARGYLSLVISCQINNCARLQRNVEFVVEQERVGRQVRGLHIII